MAKHASSLSASPSRPAFARSGRGFRRRWSFKHESGATQCREERNALASVDLAPKATGVNVDDIRIRPVRVVPYVGHELGATDDAPRIAGEVQEKCVLAGRERDGALISSDVVTERIDHQITDGDLRGGDFTAPPRERSQPRQQLSEIERLREVIVRPGIETRYATL